MPSSLPSRSYVPPVYGADSDLGSLSSTPGGISRASGSAPPTPVIGVGGMGSRTNDAFSRAIGAVAPHATYIPIGQLGLKKANAELRRQMSELDAQAMKYVLIGHSLGATAIHNMEQEPPDRYGRYASDPNVVDRGEQYRIFGGVPMPNPNYGSLLVDPPYNPPWQNAPGWIRSMVPAADAISRSSGSIPYAPGLVDWTGGKTVMKGPNPMHGFTPENQANIDALQALLRSQMNAYTNSMAGKPVTP